MNCTVNESFMQLSDVVKQYLTLTCIWAFGEPGKKQQIMEKQSWIQVQLFTIEKSW